MANFIGVDPDLVRSVSQQCTSIQHEMDDTASKLTNQLSSLHSALTGQAAQTFEEQFQKWNKHVSDLSQTIGATAVSLKQIADEAENEITALRSLAGRQG